MKNLNNLVVYRAIIGAKYDSSNSDDRVGVTKAEISRDGMLCTNRSTGQTLHSREIRLPSMEKRVPGLPVFLTSENPRLIATLNHYVSGSVPAVLECRIPLKLFEVDALALYKNYVEAGSDDIKLTNGQIIDVVRGRNIIGGEYYLLGSDLRTNLKQCPITVWRPKVMKDGSVDESAGWHQEGGSFLESLGITGRRK